MHQDSNNPYAPPEGAGEPGFPVSYRVVPAGQVFVVGMSLGALAFLVAKMMIPAGVASASQHDLLLANHLGFIYPPLLGLWAAWVRRSVPCAWYGVACGLVVGVAYYALSGYDFLAVMIGYPCVLGGCTSVLLGTGEHSWLDGSLERFFRGLAAGFVLGLTYAVVLNVVGAFILSGRTVEAYSHMMWRAGTVAMTIASGLYLLLFQSAAGFNARTPPERMTQESSTAIDTPGTA